MHLIRAFIRFLTYVPFINILVAPLFFSLHGWQHIFPNMPTRISQWAHRHQAMTPSSTEFMSYLLCGPMLVTWMFFCDLSLCISSSSSLLGTCPWSAIAKLEAEAEADACPWTATRFASPFAFTILGTTLLAACTSFAWSSRSQHVLTLGWRWIILSLGITSPLVIGSFYMHWNTFEQDWSVYRRYAVVSWVLAAQLTLLVCDTWFSFCQRTKSLQELLGVGPLEHAIQSWSNLQAWTDSCRCKIEAGLQTQMCTDLVTTFLGLGALFLILGGGVADEWIPSLHGWFLLDRWRMLLDTIFIGVFFAMMVCEAARMTRTLDRMVQACDRMEMVANSRALDSVLQNTPFISNHPILHTSSADAPPNNSNYINNSHHFLKQHELRSICFALAKKQMMDVTASGTPRLFFFLKINRALLSVLSMIVIPVLRQIMFAKSSKT